MQPGRGGGTWMQWPAAAPCGDSLLLEGIPCSPWGFPAPCGDSLLPVGIPCSQWGFPAPHGDSLRPVGIPCSWRGFPAPPCPSCSLGCFHHQQLILHPTRHWPGASRPLPAPGGRHRQRTDKLQVGSLTRNSNEAGRGAGTSPHLLLWPCRGARGGWGPTDVPPAAGGAGGSQPPRSRKGEPRNSLLPRYRSCFQVMVFLNVPIAGSGRGPQGRGCCQRHR